MMRISRMLYAAWIAILLFTLAPATIANAQTPVPETTSSGLLTFSEHDRAIRVAVVFAEKDDAVVATTVRFVDARGVVLKTRRGNLSHGAPLIAELTRSDVGYRADVLVRVEVFHQLPGVRPRRYPILITLQPISDDGFGRFLAAWNGGGCGCPTCSDPENPGRHASCIPPAESLPESPPE
jgi:hypothetical protein